MHDDLDDTILVRRMPPAPPASPQDTPAADIDDTVIPDLDSTIVRPRARPAAPPPSAMIELDDTIIPGRVPIEPLAPEQAGTSDLEDTIVRPRAGAPVAAVEDTIIVPRAALGEQAAPQSPAPPSAPPVRASLHGLRIGERLVGLERPCYIGRQPSSPRVVAGIVPLLIKVPSATRQVSSTHVEIKESGTAVVVTDLGSTNGTRVLLPGAQPRRLRQGESLVVTAGATVDLGDDIRVDIVVMAQARREGGL